ncbi:MAG: hypothetical protein KAY32_10805 [Candidatus Eisenbacteria sp.]|nr:hypothetical protein [Candidatus Eisenbacteria bacterium]
MSFVHLQYLGLVLMVLALGTPAVGAGDASLLWSDPVAGHMSLSGPLSVAGDGPLPLTDLPNGEYRFHASGHGLAAVQGRLVKSADGLRTRPWAAPTAFVLPPGLLHLERGEKRGWAFLGVGFASGAMSLVQEDRRRDAEDRLARAERTYRQAVSEAAIADARQALLTATQRRDDEGELRTLWLGYLAAAWLGAGLEAVLLTPQPTLSSSIPGQYVAALPRAGGPRAALSSLLVPGAGQRFIGRQARANFFFTTTAALAAGALIAHETFLDARRDQAAAQGRFDAALDSQAIDHARLELEEAADDVDQRNLIRWALAGAAAATYLWNIVDAFGLGRQAEVPELTLAMTSSADGFRLGVTWSLP